jgi:hypothetical protein
VAVPWLRGLVAGLSPQRHGFDPESVHVAFVMHGVALGQVLPRLFWFSPVSFIPPVLHYTETRKKIIFVTGLHNKPQGCGASVRSAEGPFTTKKIRFNIIISMANGAAELSPKQSKFSAGDGWACFEQLQCLYNYEHVDCVCDCRFSKRWP